MAVYKSKGIVLRSIRYGEADRILDLYTHNAGLVSAIAKGIRRTKSHFGGRLEPLSCVDFMAYEGRTLHTITQVEVLRSFHGVRENLCRFESAGRMVEGVRILAGGGEADRRVFNLLYRGLAVLEGRTSDFESAEASFGLKLSLLAGYTPQLDACVVCDRDLAGADGALRFAPDLGGVLCGACRASGSAFLIPPGTLEALVGLIHVPIREAVVEEGVKEGVRKVVRSHVFAHAPGNTAAGQALKPA